MNISIEKPFSISEVGKRSNNEDAIYPSSDLASVDDRLFLVCDGVGGSSKGEVASSIACESIQTYFKTFIDKEKEFESDFIEKSIRYAEVRFDDYLKEKPDAKGMATTICLLYIADNGVFLMHAGDSRIYQIRNGHILYKTEDHSLINSLIRNGQVQPHEAYKHPQKNVIYRAIQGTNFPVEVDVMKLDDIQPGDQFFMCTDGVSEAMNDDEICHILSEDETTESKLIKIKELCIGKSRDNYSAYLIPIQSISNTNSFKQIIASFLYAFM